jgi:hypothetical protein
LGQAADDYGRQRMEVHQFFQEGQAIHPRHFNVQCEHVGTQCQNLVACDVRIGRGADHLYVALTRQGLA